MTTQQSSLSDGIKTIIGDIVWCSGEPYTASQEVINLLFNHLCSCVRQLLTRLQNAQLSLETLLLAVQNDPLRLSRTVDYYRVLDSGYGEDGTVRNSDDDAEEAPTPLSVLKGNSSQRLMQLSAQLNTSIPEDERILIPKRYTPFVEGRRLRLERIDKKISQFSVNEYLKFSKMRQSASLLAVVKRSTRLAFWRWISMHTHKNSGTDEESVLDSSSVDATCPNALEDLRVLAHILTGDILHVIDLTLYYRQKLGIELTSPLTPVELKQAIHLKSAKFATPKLP